MDKGTARRDTGCKASSIYFVLHAAHAALAAKVACMANHHARHAAAKSQHTACEY